MTAVKTHKMDECGCDAGAQGSVLMSVELALKQINSRILSLPDTEDVPLKDAIGRVLAQPVVSRAPSPPFNSAAMDGYAVQVRSLTGTGPWTLKVCGRQAAGEAVSSTVTEHSAFRILTGAPVPPGAESILRQEDVTRDHDTVTIFRKPRIGENIRLKGSVLSPGQSVLEAGCLLSPRSIAAAASAGVHKLRVRRRLRVALLVTGDEILPAGMTPQNAQIWDVNTPLFDAALSNPLFDVMKTTHLEDNAEGVRAAFAASLEAADLIVTTGGISVGEEDHVLPAAQVLGVSLLFSGVAIKPGKPVSCGTIGSAVWIGLPGNPLAAFTTWQLFGRAIVSALLSAKLNERSRYAVTARSVKRSSGRIEFRPARLVGIDPYCRDIVDFDDSIDSSHAAALAGADGLVMLPADEDTLPEGSLVEFLPFCSI